MGGGPPASRPRCELRSARRLEALPGPATAHGHRSQALQAPPHARLGILSSFGAAPRSPPVPSGPSGALHTCGARCAGVWLARRLNARPGPAAAHRHRGHTQQAKLRPPGLLSVCCLARPCLRIAEPTPDFARNSPETVSGFELCSLVFQRFLTMLKLLPIELRASFLGGGCIDACWWRRRSSRARCVVV